MTWLYDSFGYTKNVLTFYPIDPHSTVFIAAIFAIAKK